METRMFHVEIKYLASVPGTEGESQQDMIESGCVMATSELEAAFRAGTEFSPIETGHIYSLTVEEAPDCMCANGCWCGNS